MSEELENLASMSLGDHLEELRHRLILAIAGLLVGMIICLFFGSYLVKVMLIPYNNLVKTMQEDRNKEEEAQKKLDEENGLTAETDNFKLLIPYESFANSLDKAKLDIENGKTDQVNIELQIPREMLIGQLKEAMLDESGIAESSKKADIELGAIQPSESFMVYLKTSMFFGLLITSPWVLYQLWAFISAGLYQKEKKYVHAVVPASAILFITGSVFFMWVIAPLMMGFFAGFDQMLGFVSRWSPQYYISLILTMTLVFGAAFQMPIVVVFANLMNLVSIEMLAKGRRFVFLGLLVVSALATPPDVISQVALAAPLYILYEGSIVVCRIIRKRKTQAS
ncbi:MAG: twin-arginine translocase subunit TatC [Anaerohalosphaera sp.]|nr:twin-arginine translocase subunit TatC [Anaerohalosphaera sp.]